MRNTAWLHVSGVRGVRRMRASCSHRCSHGSGALSSLRAVRVQPAEALGSTPGGFRMHGATAQQWGWARDAGGHVPLPGVTITVRNGSPLFDWQSRVLTVPSHRPRCSPRSMRAARSDSASASFKTSVSTCRDGSRLEEATKRSCAP
jgi:hypothetical protein